MGAAPSSASAPAQSSSASPSASPPASSQPRTLGARPTHSAPRGPARPDDLPATAARLALSGSSPRLRYGGARDKPPAPVAFPAPVQQQAVVGNVVNLLKATLRVVPSRDAPHIYLVEFEFDAKVDGFITVYYAAQQRVHIQPQSVASPSSASSSSPGSSSSIAATPARVERVSFTGLVEARPSKTRFSAGTGQAYRHKLSKGIDTSKYAPADLLYVEGSDRFPLVIRLEAIYPPESPVPLDERVQTQTTLATFKTHRNATEPYSVAVIRQDVLVGGTVYKIQELYGIAGEVTAEMLPPSTDENGTPIVRDVAAQQIDTVSADIGNECVICLTEPCSTAVLPCNHLCMCAECSERLCSDSNWERRRCPVCRTTLGSLLRIIAKPQSAAAETTSVDVPGVSHQSQGENEGGGVTDAETARILAGFSVNSPLGGTGA
jgi:E3 ubiquitin-protein ligase MGRN1